MSHKKTLQLPTLTFFLLLAGNSWATPISYSANFGLDIDIGSYTNDGGAIDANYSTLSLLTLPGFDSSLGTLNSVGISFTSEYGTLEKAIQ